MPGTHADALIGRQDESRRLDALLQAAREGRGGVLVLRGEPGIGKSALLRRLDEAATGFLVMRASGAEFEMELPFAALHQLLAPVTGRLTALPAPHRKALEIAFGLDTGTPDPFLVGAASLGLLVETAQERPLLCVVDDAQWLDRASAKALAFLARRVSAESVALVFAAREPSRLPELDELPGHSLQGLGASDARALLAAAIRAPLDERVRDRILAEARGNPLALVELPRTAGLAGMAGGFAQPDSVPGVIEQSFRFRLELLPPAARLLVTVAAADPLGDPGLLWRAAALLGIDAAAAAESVPLVEFGTRIRFSHPLARSAAYGAAAPEERRRAHEALAAVTDPVADPDRRAWHRAQASAGPDEQVAAELETSATRAQERGGVAAAAAFLERSAALTISPVQRTERALAAVEAKLSVGDFDTAADLLTTVRTGDPSQAARADLVRGRLSFARRRGDEDPTAYVLGAAARLAATDPGRSRECCLDAIEMGLLLGSLDHVVEAVRKAPPSGEPLSGAAAVLTGLISLVGDGHTAAGEILGPVVDDADDEVWARRPSLGFMLATELWNFGALRGIAARAVAAGRESGSFHALPVGLAMQATAAVHTGDFGAAMELISEEEAIADATGAAPLVYPRLHLAAMRGRRGSAVELFASVDHRMSLSAQWATAVLSNGLADYPAALKAARQAVEYGAVGTAGLALPELVESAMRCGETEVAAAALASLQERTRAGRQAWGLGVEAYARALVNEDESAYQEAIGLLDDSALVVYRARAQLLYGEWLRRQGRRRDARVALRSAHESLSDLGVEAFAERAAGELRATGEQARSRTSKASDQLTMQEVHIARLVADGATSKEVAAKLFLSPRTVDAHLRNIFRKLGLTSRRQLRDLPDIRQPHGGSYVSSRFRPSRACRSRSPPWSWRSLFGTDLGAVGRPTSSWRAPSLETRFTRRMQLPPTWRLSDRESGPSGPKSERAGQVVGRRKGGIGIALLTGVMLVGASACGGGSGDTAGGDDAKASGKPSATASPSPTKPAGPPMLLETITPQTGTTVGVAMPISVIFTNPVAAKARATVEKHMKVSASQPVAGAWHWFGDKRADWRPKTYWPSDTTVKIDADMEGVSNGNGRYGVHGYTHTFKIGDDVRADVSVTGHTMKVTRNGQEVRTLSINAGSAEYPTWNGTMAVIDKQEKVHMTSCSVGISCDKGSPDYYDLTLPWDVHLTQSGTYVHYSTGDPNPGSGSARGSHGCVHLSMSDAKWFYGQVKQGDPVTVTGSPRAKASADNGYAGFNLGWDQWLAGSASGEGTTAAL